jgi:PAS domain S-box-containing protein
VRGDDVVPGRDGFLPESGQRHAAIRRPEATVTQAPLRVLLVEDDAAHAELARRAFETRPDAFVVAVAETLEAARVSLAAPAPPDIVIADWRLPDGDGVDLLRGDPRGGLPPVVIMTSHGNERVAVEVIRAGAADYVVKSDTSLADLPHLAERALRQRRIEETLADIVAGTSGAGAAFFESLVLRLARALRVKYASVGERRDGDRLRTLARCLDGDLVENVEYPLAGSPCAEALEGTVCYVRSGVASRFPRDEGLARMGAESYVGIALVGAGGKTLGLINAVHDRPLDEALRPESVLQVFAGRAAAELERLEAERALRRQSQFAESLLDMVASLVIVVDPRGRIVRFNRACETTSGWTENEVRGRRFWEVLRPPGERAEMARFFEDGGDPRDFPLAYEAIWQTRDGERRLLSWVNRPIRDDSGQLASIMGTGLDITESRRTEEALRASEERYRTLVRHAPEAIVLVDAEREAVVDANANAERLFGLDREGLSTARLDSLFSERQPDGRAAADVVRRLWAEALDGGAPVVELVHRAMSGEVRPCEVRLVRLPGPGSLVRLSILDIGERQRLEADLKRAALEWRQTFDGLPLGVMVVDGRGRVVRANRAAVERSGRRSWADLIECPLTKIGPGEPWAALGALVGSLLSGERPAPREVTDPASGETWFVSASPLPTDGEGPGRVILNFQDVSETARLKEQLRQTETMAAIGSVVAGVAHEVRNPLFSISATLDAFEARFGQTEGYGRYLGVLRGEIGRLTTLMKDLLEFGRPSRPTLGECHLEDAIRGAIQACAPVLGEKSVEVVWPSEGEALPLVLADRGRMTQVLQNLIENAVHYSPSGGRVHVTLERRGHGENERVECSVRDSGPGFDMADLPQLFQPFFTRRRGGTGLGLSIVKRIVYDHGGDVFAWNHPEGGAVVTIRLRRARP